MGWTLKKKIMLVKHNILSSTLISAPYLMFHVMLHVWLSTSEHFEAERAQEVFRVVVSYFEMSLHFHEEWGPEIANLKTRRRVGENQWALTLCGLLFWFKTTRPLTWHTYGISPGLWVSFMCSSRTCSVSNANSHILQLAEEDGGVSLCRAGTTERELVLGGRVLLEDASGLWARSTCNCSW